MLPTSTVENYLKAIYLGVQALPPGHRLLPMGQLASALGITPGTATTMVKTLAEAGLADYEPYSGVTLSPAGEKLAALVLRRHRLVELFLVEFMGFGWDEVHDEAEHLEHVVSDRLIARMDEMLGRPEADPHGDPIPDPDGSVKPQVLESLLACPLHAPVIVARVIDQDRAFLQFIERHDLKPGAAIEVEARDSAADCVEVKGRDDRRVTIGTRAASKILVQGLGVVLWLLGALAPLLAQTPAASPGGAGGAGGSSRPFEIVDNSFFVEEAFNQEAGVVQSSIGLHAVRRGEWEAAFTQEWPVPGQTHQLSYTLPLERAAGRSGLGDVAVHYRLQAMVESGRRPACAPRVSLLLPSGDSARGFGSGGVGWQVNVPISKQLRNVYLHGNAGITRTGGSTSGSDAHGAQLTPTAGASAIWRVAPMLNLMFEGTAAWAPATSQSGRREAAMVLSPGLRAGWNRGASQTVAGVALPVGVVGGTARAGVFGYISYETRFRPERP